MIRFNEVASPEDGFTLVETSVALLVASLAVGLCLGAYVFSVRVVSNWEMQMAYDRARHVVADRLARDALATVTVHPTPTPDGVAGWTLVQTKASTATYLLRGGRLTRNGISLHGEKVRVADFDLRMSSPQKATRPTASSVVSGAEALSIRRKRLVAMVTFEVRGRSGRHHLPPDTVWVHVQPRAAAIWPPPQTAVSSPTSTHLRARDTMPWDMMPQSRFSALDANPAHPGKSSLAQ